MKVTSRSDPSFTVTEKYCPACGETKPRAAFRLATARKDGLQAECRTCMGQRDKARYAADPEGQRQRVRDYRAADPARTKQQRRASNERLLARDPDYWRRWRAAHLAKARGYGRKHYAKQRSRYAAYAINRYRADPDAINAQRRARFAGDPLRWRAAWIAAAGRRRARKRRNGVEPVSVERIIARDGLRCHICKKPIDRAELSLDHLVPISKGGPHAEWNLSPAHVACNTRRGAGRTPAQLHLPLR